jgi:hypothetical protein
MAESTGPGVLNGAFMCGGAETLKEGMPVLAVEMAPKAENRITKFPVRLRLPARLMGPALAIPWRANEMIRTSSLF